MWGHHQEVEFPEGMSEEAMDLLRGLLCKEPTIRLGADRPKHIRDHEFFRCVLLTLIWIQITNVV